jgi:hypothetical protein
MQTLLKKYIRNQHGQRRGVIVANKNGTGFSLCRKGDKYNEDTAIDIAVVRANLNSENGEVLFEIPNSIARDFSRMEKRGKNYFKN